MGWEKNQELKVNKNNLFNINENEKQISKYQSKYQLRRYSPELS
jgi:hypothetical protein